MKAINILMLLSFAGTQCHSQITMEKKVKQYSIEQQSKLLSNYYDTIKLSTGENKIKYEKLFFNIFPSSFGRFDSIYGYTGEEADANYMPLFLSCANHIKLFEELNSVDKKLYFEKLIDIGIGGRHDVDCVEELQQTMGLKVNQEMKLSIEVLNAHTEGEIREFWHFIFDYPYPNKQKNFYEDLYSKARRINPHIADLMKQEYEKLLKERNNE